MMLLACRGVDPPNSLQQILLCEIGQAPLAIAKVRVQALAILGYGVRLVPSLTVYEKLVPRIFPTDRAFGVKAKGKFGQQFFRLVTCLLQADRWVSTDGLAGTIWSIDHHKALRSTLRDANSKARQALIPYCSLSSTRWLKRLQGAV